MLTDTQFFILLLTAIVSIAISFGIIYYSVKAALSKTETILLQVAAHNKVPLGNLMDEEELYNYILHNYREYYFVGRLANTNLEYVEFKAKLRGWKLTEEELKNYIR